MPKSATMNQDIRLSLDSNITLRNLSSVNIAISLWETPKIKREIRKFGAELHYKDVVTAYDDKRTWVRICIKVLDQLKDFSYLPVGLIHELEKLIIFIGDKVFLWTVYVIKEFLFDVKHSQQIIWMTNGLIDEAKIYRDLWRDDPRFPGISDITVSKIALYTLSCIHADEEFINRNLKDIASVIEPNIGLRVKNVNKLKVTGAVTILLTRYFSSKSRNVPFGILYGTLKSTEYPTGTDKMFFYCAIYGFTEAAEYFYKKLKPEDREKSVFSAALECVRDAYKKMNFNYEKSRLPESLLYLLNKIPMEQKKRFLAREIVNIFIIFFFVWPYQDLCIPILDYVWNDLSSHTVTDLVQGALAVYQRFCDTQHNAYKFVLNPILEYLLKKGPKSLSKYFKKFLTI